MASVMEELGGFEEVWRRVSGKGGEGPSEEDTLRRLMDAETRSAEFYEKLARQIGGDSRKLRHMAEEEREHFRALQLEYYLLTGDSHVPAESCPVVSGVLAALRGAYHAELSAAESYTDAAEATKSPRMREMYLCHADDERRHASLLRRMLREALR